VTNTADVSSLLLPELRTFAQDLGVAGAATMRKSELIAAIEAKQNSVDVGIEEVSEIQETNNDQDSAIAAITTATTIATTIVKVGVTIIAEDLESVEEGANEKITKSAKTMCSYRLLE
jgi:hypothetical protein